MSDLSSIGSGEYRKSKLNEKDLPAHPIELFEKWLMAAFEADLPEPTAMTLATSDGNGRVSSRIVLLKGFDKNGFQFYTNYNSRKGQDLEKNDLAAISFFWPELEKQIRIEGVIKKMKAKDSDLYHSARCRNNQMGAWASEQSKPIKDRYTLEAQFEAVKKAYANEAVIPRPSGWGGYVLLPSMIEFWQGRESRLHDRIEFFRENNSWAYRRLNP